MIELTFTIEKKIKDDSYYILAKRLLKETYDSIEIANFIQAALEDPNLEIHVDVSPDPKNKSNKFKKMLCVWPPMRCVCPPIYFDSEHLV
jgi:predicted RNase H-related nuclease YkuK (DUF458 family)